MLIPSKHYKYKKTHKRISTRMKTNYQQIKKKEKPVKKRKIPGRLCISGDNFVFQDAAGPESFFPNGEKFIICS